MRFNFKLTPTFYNYTHFQYDYILYYQSEGGLSFPHIQQVLFFLPYTTYISQPLKCDVAPISFLITFYDLSNLIRPNGVLSSVLYM
jgi:hypothetical protein